MTGSMTKKNRVEFFEAYLEEMFPDPRCELHYQKDYELLIAVMLSAQTTDKRVNQVTEVLSNRYPSLEKLNEATEEEISEILVPIGTFRKKAVFVKEIVYKLLNEFQGKVPNDPKVLETFSGVGHKTVNVVLSNLFDYPAIAVDTHVERVSKRLKFAPVNVNVSEVEKCLERLLDRSVWSRRHHQMVLFGRYHCQATSPKCGECKMREYCSYHKSSNIK